MEDTVRRSAITAIAPVAWGSNYYVTASLLPEGHPLSGAAVRALPAGVLLLLIARRLPRGNWWWRSLVLGTLNVAVFFTLIYLTSQLLPTSVASTAMASSAAVLTLVAWLLNGERPQVLHLVGSAVGLGGVALLLLTSATGLSTVGIATSLSAMLCSSLGFVLAKRWSGPIDLVASTAWQLMAGGLLLCAAAALTGESVPPLDTRAVIGFSYVTLFATALAFLAWFAGLRSLSTGTVGLLGLLNPVTGVLLGLALAGENLSARQFVGLLLVLGGVALGQPIVTRLLWHRRAGDATPSPTRS